MSKNMGYWIIVCIDGTGSKDWRWKKGGVNGQSHVYKFYDNFGQTIEKDTSRNKFGGREPGWEITYTSKTKKIFLDGPSDEVTGSDSPIIKHFAQTFIATNYRMLKKTASRYSKRNYQGTLKVGKKNINIVLVGHSRGGAMVLDVARWIKSHLKERVYFMGLFDAVDMSIYIDGGKVENTKFAYHALRNALGSRDSWGNAGLEGLPKQNIKKFATSHGGIGGDPVLHPKEFFADYSCSVDTLSSNIENYLGRDRGEICVQESQNSYTWMIGKARANGLPI